MIYLYREYRLNVLFGNSTTESDVSVSVDA